MKYFPFYPSDFLADMNVQAMNLEERGLYVTLLCLDWQEDGLPTDMKKIAKILKISEKKLKNLFSSMEMCFTVHNSKLHNNRLIKERKKVSDIIEKRSNAAKSRWCKSNASAMQVHSKTDANTMQTHDNQKININNNKEKEKINKKEKESEARIYDHYKNKIRKAVDKRNSIKSISKLLKEGITEDTLMLSIDNYAKEIDRKGTDRDFITQSNNFFGIARKFECYIGVDEKYDDGEGLYDEIL